MDETVELLDFDSLIPEELKAAVHAQEEEDEEDTPPQASTPPQQTQQAQTKDTPPEPAPKVTVSDKVEDDEDDDVDLSPETLAKLAEGNLDALNEPTTPKEQEEEPPFWVDDEIYKGLTKTLNNYGIESKKVDELLKKVVDKHTVDNSTLIQNTRKEYDELYKQKQTQDAELARLKTLERGVRFDNLPSTADKFLNPMVESEKVVREILDREGARITEDDIFRAKNKAELANVLSNYKFEDKDYTRIVNQWRAYKDLETGYIAAKKEAQNDLSKALVTHLSGETIDTIFRNNLMDAIKREEFSPLAEAIKNGITKTPELADVVARSRSNFVNFMNALNRSEEAVSDQKFMNSVSNLMLRAAYNDHLVEQSKGLQKNYDLAMQGLNKLAKEYKKLAASARGIQGKKGQAFIKKEGVLESSDDMDAKAKALTDFISGKKSFDEL